MRLPLVTEIDSRNGTSDKDERLTNTLSETDEDKQLAVVRPVLSSLATTSGIGNGIVNFNDVLISVYGTSIKHSASLSSITTVIDEHFDFAQSPL